MADRRVLLVIVGAGASHDCLTKWPPATPGRNHSRPCSAPDRGLRHEYGVDDVRPPLAGGLVADTPGVVNVLGRYVSCRPLVAHLRRALATTTDGGAPTFEQALAQYVDRSSVDPNIQIHVAAFRFFLRDLLWQATDYMLSPNAGCGMTSYQDLVERLYGWARETDRELVFVSFNYDYLLEEACRAHCGMNPFDLVEYHGRDDLAVLKPHGSILWRWVFDGEVTGQVYKIDDLERETIRIAPTLTEAPRTLHIQSMPMHRASSIADSNQHALPALALPVARKSEWIWPDEQATRFESLAGRVDRMITIGWRAAEPHFLGRLKDLPVAGDLKGIVIDGGPGGDKAASEAASRISRVVGGWDPALVGDGFSYTMKVNGRFDDILEEWASPDPAALARKRRSSAL